MEEKYVLGLNIGLHDSSVAILKNGVLVAMAEEERFIRKKIAERKPPIEATKFCLKKAGISLKDVKAIALGTDWDYRDSLLEIPQDERDKWIKVNDIERYLPKEVFGEKLPQILTVKHHIAHAASAYRMSGFNEAAILVVDNRGENESTSLGYAKDGDIVFFKQFNIAKSLGIFYSRACQYTGLYGKYREVGKFMGLASYGNANMKMPIKWNGNEIICDEISQLNNVNNYDVPTIRTKEYSDYFQKNCFPYQKGNIEEIMAYANFAASAQSTLEEIYIGLAKKLKEVTGLNNLVIAGGVALNCSANGRLEREKIFDNIFVQPVAGDDGTALGAALQVDFELFGERVQATSMKNCYYGEEYSNKEILAVLDKYSKHISYRKYSSDELCDVVSSKLADGDIVAWFQGRFEIGPRALGHRSILATPQSRKSLIKLNLIKEREMWRPIAPSVLKSEYSCYFEGTSENKQFMNMATLVKEKVRKDIPAVVHIDNTARPQVVSDKDDIYYKLIERFAQKTGIPVICNTSFNGKGEPLVASPEDAIRTFLNKKIDYLAIGGYMVEKIAK